MTKKIIIIHHGDGVGGAAQSLINVCMMLQQEYEVTVALYKEAVVLKSLFEKSGIKYLTLNNPVGQIAIYSGSPKILSRSFTKLLIYIRDSSREIREIIENGNYDYIAINSITTVWVGLLLKKINCKKVCFVRETRPRSVWFNINRCLLQKYFDIAFFISEFDRIQYNLHMQRQKVVYNVVDEKKYMLRMEREEACEKYNLKSSTFNVLYVGGTLEIKGARTLCSMMNLLKKYSDINFVIAGNVGDDRFENVSNASIIGICTDMPSLYKCSDVLVFPSVFPHQARPAIEAGFFAIPVIISDFPETKEFIIDGFNGLTAKPNDPEDFAKKIVHLYEDVALRDELGLNNYRHVQRQTMKVQKEALLEGFSSL